MRLDVQQLVLYDVGPSLCTTRECGRFNLLSGCAPTDSLSLGSPGSIRSTGWNPGSLKPDDGNGDWAIAHAPGGGSARPHAE